MGGVFADMLIQQISNLRTNWTNDLQSLTFFAIEGKKNTHALTICHLSFTQIYMGLST